MEILCEQGRTIRHWNVGRYFACGFQSVNFPARLCSRCPRGGSQGEGAQPCHLRAPLTQMARMVRVWVTKQLFGDENA